MPLVNYIEKIIYIVYVIRSELGNFWYFLPYGKYNPYHKEILAWCKTRMIKSLVESNKANKLFMMLAKAKYKTKTKKK